MSDKEIQKAASRCSPETIVLKSTEKSTYIARPIVTKEPDLRFPLPITLKDFSTTSLLFRKAISEI